MREQAHHRIAGDERCLGGGVDDDPGGFAAHAFVGDDAQRHDHVTEVQPGGPHLNADLARGQRRGRVVGSRVRLVRSPLRGGAQLPGGIRWGQGRGAGQTGDVDNAVAQGQLRLAGRRRRGDGQQVVLGGGVIGIEQDDAVGVLVLGGADQRPGRGMRQIGSTVVGTDADGVRVTIIRRALAVSGRASQLCSWAKTWRVRVCVRRNGSASPGGSGQITRSGHGVKAARSVWIVPPEAGSVGCIAAHRPRRRALTARAVGHRGQAVEQAVG